MTDDKTPDKATDDKAPATEQQEDRVVETRSETSSVREIKTGDSGQGGDK